MRWFLFIFVLFFAGLADAQERKALLIGNAGYTKIAALSNPVRDVELIERALKAADFEVRVVRDADRASMRAAVDAFIADLQANPGSVALIYFSGHGLQSDYDADAPDKRGRIHNYVLGVDFDDTTGVYGFAQSAMPVDGPDGFATRLEASRTSQNILVIDACRNVYQPRNIQKRGFAPVEVMHGSDTFYIFATKPEDVAMDRAVTGDGTNSPFAMAFAEMLGKRGHTPSSIMPALVNRVRALTGNAQTPYSEGIDRGDFQFRPGLKESLENVSAEAEAMIWQDVKLSRSKIRVNDFLLAFPDGPHANEARALLARLNAGLETDVAPVVDLSRSAQSVGLTVGQEFAGGRWSVQEVDSSSVFAGRLVAGDELYKINGRSIGSIENPDEEILKSLSDRGSVALTVLRNGRPYKVTIR